MKKGYVLFTGAIVSEELARAYNAATAKIDSFIEAGINVPENLLNGRHNLLNSYATNCAPIRESN